MSQPFTHLRAVGDFALHVGMTSTQRMADAFSMAGHPVALLARDASVIHLNARFERLVDDGICMRAGRLGSWQPDADRAFEAAIGKAMSFDDKKDAPLAPIVLPRRNGLRPLVAEILPVIRSAHDVLHLVAAIVTLTDLEATGLSPSEALLEQAFSLTPAEARLASQIAAGRTLAEIAANERNARETLRSRLKAVFQKTGTRRQAELTLLLSRIARF